MIAVVSVKAPLGIIQSDIYSMTNILRHMETEVNIEHICHMESAANIKHILSHGIGSSQYKNTFCQMES